MRPSVLRRVVLTLSASCLALAGVAALPGPAGAATAPSDFRPFASDSVWNLPLRADAPVSPASARSVSWLTAQVASKGAWINSTQCGMPLYWADATTPTVPVALDHPSYMDPALIRAWSAVPIPAEAAAAACGDRNFSVAQVQPDGRVKEWEFWDIAKRADGTWVAHWGGAMSDMRTDRGVASSWAWRDLSAPIWAARYATPGWNVTASSISQNAGVVTQAELRSGHIDHAVAIALNDTAAGRWLWPAQRTDGSASDPAALPEGAHLRLDPALDLSTVPMTPLVRMLAEAAQRYGVVVRDKSFSADVFYTESPAPGASDPVAALLAGQRPDQALRVFPWARLQLLDAPTCTDWRGCSVAPRARIDVDGTATAGGSVRLDTTNSVLDQPRTKVEWDLDGDGTYETPGGLAVSTALATPAPGPRTVGVRITTLDGQVVTATRTFDVAAAGAAPPPSAPAVPPTAVVVVAPTPAPAPASAPRPAPASAASPGSGAQAVRGTPTPPRPPVRAPAPRRRARAAAAVVVARRLSVARRGSILLVSVRCRARHRSCGGVATVRLATPLHSAGGTVPAGTRLGSRRFAARGSRSQVLRITVTARMARVLRAANVRQLPVRPTLR